MRIGYFSDTYLPTINGVSTSVEFGFKNLVKRGHEVYLITTKSPRTKKEKNVFRLPSMKVNKVFNYRFGFVTPGVFTKFLKKDLDIIHGHAVGPISLIGLFMARLKKIPYVYTYHTMMADYAHYVPLGILTPKMIDRIAKSSCNKCDCLIAPSDKVKNELLSLGVKKPIEVVPTGVKVESFKISKKDFLRNKFNLKADDRIILHAGRLGKEKSVDFLIYAFRIICNKDFKNHLVIVGGGPELTYLKSLSERLKIENNVHFNGPIEPSKMPLVYNGAELFIFSSRTETQGLVVLEAMAAALPIVAVYDEAVMETIKHSIHGILVDKNTSNFAEEVLKLLGNKKERERLGRNAREKAISISKESIDKLEAIYRKLKDGGS